jgi:FkbM family methyltransferase
MRCRPSTTDLNVYYQIFFHREYRCLDDAKDVELIVDCGANVGYSAAYFLSRFPQAKLIAVEPDPQNFSVLLDNLAPYGNRVHAVSAAVWSHPVGLVMSEARMGPRSEWARQVRPAKAGETPAIVATDVGTLLRESGFDRISILKIDIEGSESAVFSANYEPWIDKVDCLVIELHGERCRSVFFNAISAQDFSISQCEELTICRRRFPDLPGRS